MASPDDNASDGPSDDASSSSADELNCSLLAEWLKRNQDGLPRAAVHARSLRNVLHLLFFYRVRCKELQDYQKHLPEPHRTIVCNILANGSQTALGRVKETGEAGGDSHSVEARAQNS